jgi:heme/copper-type cytochrome/quinol oxidase subunit 2
MTYSVRVVSQDEYDAWVAGQRASGGGIAGDDSGNVGGVPAEGSSS